MEFGGRGSKVIVSVSSCFWPVFSLWCLQVHSVNECRYQSKQSCRHFTDTNRSLCFLSVLPHSSLPPLFISSSLLSDFTFLPFFPSVLPVIIASLFSLLFPSFFCFYFFLLSFIIYCFSFLCFFSLLSLLVLVTLLFPSILPSFFSSFMWS